MWINKIIYILLTIYAAVLSVLYLQVQALYVFIVLLSLPLFFILQVSILKRKIYITLTSEAKMVVAGTDNIPISLMIGNASLFPVACVKVKIVYENAFAQAGSKQVFTLSVGARSKKFVNFNIKSSHVGMIKIQVTKVKVYDFIRLFSRTSKQKAEVIVPVMPEIYGIRSDIMIKDPDFIESDVFSKNKPGDDPSEVFDIREYKEGDRVHRIHWKLSSKKDMVMVKDYSLPIANSATILINTSLPKDLLDKLTYLDAITETIAAVSYHLLIHGYHHIVAWYEQKQENYVSNSLGDLDDLYYMMSNFIRVIPTEEKNDILDAHQIYGKEKKVTKIYYITNELTEDGIQVLLTSYGQAQIEVLVLGDSDPEDDVSLGQGFHIQQIAITDSRSTIEALQL